MALFVQAQHFANANRGVGDIHRLVAHSAEITESRDSAESVAAFFAGIPADAPPKKRVSAHACGDANSIVQCVRDEDIAFHAAGDNTASLGFEFSGFAGQTAKLWRDDFSMAMLERAAANWWAPRAMKYGIPLRWLTRDQLRRHAKGFVTHEVVSDVFGEGIRSDPGDNFPYDEFLRMVAGHMRPPEAPKLQYVLTNGEGGQRILVSAESGVGPVARKERLRRFLLTAAENVDKLDAEFEQDEAAGEPEDIIFRRVKA